MRVNIIVVAIVMALFSGCDLEPKKNRKTDNSIKWPSFTVEPFEYTHTAAALYVDEVNCTAEMNKSNTAGMELAEALTENEDGGELALAMAADMYAKTIFYDCNLRQQLADNKPEEIEDTNSHILYRAGSVSKEVFENTRFVEWKELKDSEGNVPKTDDEANDVEGIMTNLQGKDSIPTFTQISLNKNGSLRQLGALMEGRDGDISPTWSGFVVEHKSGTDKEHLLGMRLFDHNEKDKIYLLLAHFKADGAALLIGECEIESDEDNNKSCADVDYEASYYDQEKKKIEDDIPSGFKKAKDDFLTNVDNSWAHGSYFANKLDSSAPFFAGTGDTKANRENFFTANLPTATE